MTVSTNTDRPPLRAVYIGTVNQPARYSLGIAIETLCFDDPASHEHLAWAFKPDDDENAYYMEESELSFEPEEIKVRERLCLRKRIMERFMRHPPFLPQKSLLRRPLLEAFPDICSGGCL